MATAELPPALSRSWFAAFLRETFSVAELTAATNRHATLASKFRSGAEFPKLRYLDELASRTHRVELVLGAIALLEEFADLREAIDASIAGHVGDAEPARVPVRTDAILHLQLDRRLREVEGIGDVVRAAGSIALVVANGHGVTQLHRRLQLRVPEGRAVLDLSGSALGAVGPDAQELLRNCSDVTVVVPASGRSAVAEVRLPLFDVPSPTWSDVFEGVFGHRPSPPLQRAGGPLFDRLPLAVVQDALIAYHHRRTSPARLQLSPRPVCAPRLVAPVQPRSLSVAQVSALEPVVDDGGPDTWGVIVPDGVDVPSVAEQLARRTKGARPFKDADFAGILRAWAKVVEAPATLPTEPGTGRPLRPRTALVLEITTGLPLAGLDAIAAIASAWRQSGSDGRWYLCGSVEALQAVAAALVDELPVVELPPNPSQEEAPPRKAVRELQLLPDPSWFSTREAARAAWFDDHWELERRFALLSAKTYVEVPAGQGASLAARALMAMRWELDRADQAIVSIEDNFVDGIDELAEEVLREAGFLSVRKVGSIDRSMVGSPYLYAGRLSDDKRLVAAERVAARLFGESSMPLRHFPDEVLYLDLSPTRYGRVPVGGRNTNKPERLLPTYLAIARSLLAEAARRQALTFVFAPPELHDPELLPLDDWGPPSVLDPLPRLVVHEIRRRHGFEPLPATPRLLLSSIATAEVSAAPAPRKDAGYR